MDQVSLINFLQPLQDERYALFTAKLVPNKDPQCIVGVRMSHLRALAKELLRENPTLVTQFLNSLPHKYHEENLLHAILLAGQKEPDFVLAQINSFLPYIDNWAVCDALTPRSLAKIQDRLFQQIQVWIASEHEFTQRYALVALMQHFLGERFEFAQFELLQKLNTEQYYVLMGAAWYLATVAEKQPVAAVSVLLTGKINGVTLPAKLWRKAIQKTVESRRIDPQFKTELRAVREQIPKA